MSRDPSMATLTLTLTVSVASKHYFVRPRVEAHLPSIVPATATDVRPVVIIDLHTDQLSLESIKSRLDHFAQNDDVFTDGFARGGYLIMSQPSPSSTFGDNRSKSDYLPSQAISVLPPDLVSFLQNRSLTFCVLEGEHLLPEGPYFAHGHKLHQAWRLYADHLGAFASTVVPDDSEPCLSEHDIRNRRYKPLGASAFTGVESSVAVPSRLYFPKTEHKPLNGLRISIKDNMHLSGIVTTLGSKSFSELYGPQAQTARMVEVLVSKGAIIVGKTKLSAFAGSEIPPKQCIDYFPPWNPRGDGYQGPSGSSSGAAASIAGYQWLDSSICTDTSGSMRFPATSHGVWGLRTSWNSISMDGVVPSCATYDNFGILARTTKQIAAVLNVSVRSLSHDNPNRILYPVDWLPVADRAQQAMIESFVQRLEDCLNVKRERISLSDIWTTSGPENLRSRPLYKLEDLGWSLGGFDEYHNFDEFRAQYKNKFGKEAYVSPSHTERWDLDKLETPQSRAEGLEAIEKFRQWVYSRIIPVDNTGTSRSIMIVPHGRPGPNYRDFIPPQSNGTTNDPPKPDPVFWVTMMGGPQIVVPIGQTPYESRVSMRTEYVPIFATIVGAPDADGMILKLAQDALTKAEWPTEILTGRFMFEVGDNERFSIRPQAGPRL